MFATECAGTFGKTTKPVDIMNDLAVNSIVFKKSCKLMGNRFELSVVSDNELWANERIDAGIAEIKRIEQLLTTFSDDSETNRVNQNAGIKPTRVSAETFALVE